MLSLRPFDPIAMRERVASRLICRAGDRLRVIEETRAIRGERGRTMRYTCGNCRDDWSSVGTDRRPGTLEQVFAECAVAVPLRTEKDGKIS